GAQLRIPIRPIAALTRRAIATLRPTLVALRPIRPIGPLLGPRRTILSILLVLPIRPVAGLLAIRTATMTPMLLVRALACLGGHAFRNSRSAFGTGRRLHLGAAMSLMWPAWRPALAVRTSARAP